MFKKKICFQNIPAESEICCALIDILRQGATNTPEILYAIGVPVVAKTYKFVIWPSHADEVTKLSPDFIQLARSDVCEVEAMRHKSKPLFGVQWHPEVSHTEKGDELLENFFRVCEE